MHSTLPSAQLTGTCLLVSERSSVYRFEAVHLVNQFYRQASQLETVATMTSSRSSSSIATARHPSIPASTSAAHPSKRSHSSANLASQHRSTFGLTSIQDPNTSVNTVNFTTTTTAAPTNRRTQSGLMDDHHVTSIGPKRKSRLGISGMHAGAGVGRKSNASSTALSRKEKSKSHASIANLASEMVMARGQSHHETSHSSEENIDYTKEERKSVDFNLNKEAKVDPDDAEAGWISATSSKAGTPEMQNSPGTSPSSFQPLEFGKKVRRRKDLDHTAEGVETFSQVPILDAALAATPKQGSSLPHRVPPEFLQQQQQEQLSVPKKACQEDGAKTPTKENQEAHLQAPYAPPEKELQQIQPTSPFEKSPSPHLTTSANAPLDANVPPVISANRLDSSRTVPRQQAIGSTSRPQALREPSTSTLRTITSMSARLPISPSLRKQAVPLQPRLDTQVEGYGTIVEQGTGQSLSPEQLRQSSMSFPSVKGKETQFNTLGHQRQMSAVSMSRTDNLKSPSTRTGTLTSAEAQDLAKRLRTVSGSDVRSIEALGITGKKGLNRSTSTASTNSLLVLAEADHAGSSSGGRGVSGTLKRASGYFGSISRLASLAGFTNAGSGGSGHTSPILPASDNKRFSPGVATSGSIAQHSLLSTSPTQKMVGFARSGKGIASINHRQPLISKFIDPDEGSTLQSGASTSHASQYINPVTSRQRQQAPLSNQAKPKTKTRVEGLEDNEHGRHSSDTITLPAEQTSFTEEDDVATTKNLGSHIAYVSKQEQLAPGVQRWITALVKEAERIDKDHETAMRFNNSLQASMARVLERKAANDDKERQEERAARREREKEKVSQACLSRVFNLS